MKKVMVLFGTRPEAIKMAPLIKKLKEREEFKTIITITSQHREMLDQVLDLFDIKHDYDLDIMKSGQSITDISIKILKKLDKIISKENPDIILVHGDTSTTFVGALASFYKKIKIGHVEAGLRTNNKYSPFPEEMNRHMTGVLADLHFTPTKESKKNLISENISSKKIHITGNTVIDALLGTVEQNYNFKSKKLNSIDFKNKKVIILTTHRRENLGKPLENIYKAIKRIVYRNEEVEVIFPVHLNPKVRDITYEILGEVRGVHLIEPLDYKPFVNLMAKSYLVMTDSGGIQEEAPSLGKPVLVLRDTTERPEAIKAGTVNLVGTNKEKIIKETNKLIDSNTTYRKRANAINPYGDGSASERIVNILLKELVYSL